jgi:uncharacterized membrane protein
MAGWQAIWTWIFGLSVVLFFLVEIVVVFGGAKDIRDMLDSLREHAEQERRNQEPEGGG